MRIAKDFSLKNYNSFKIDVMCRHFAEFDTKTELIELLQNKDYNDEKKLPLGVGSNLLFTGNYEGLILKNEIKGIEIIGEDSECAFVKAGGGEIWDDLVDFSLENNLGGIENLVLIPGSVGAAPVQNIGAYGQEVKDTFYSLELIVLETGELISLNKEMCNFGYRSSVFKKELKNRTLVVSVTFKLQKNPVSNPCYGDIKKEFEYLAKEHYSIQEVSRAIKRIRERKLPDPKITGSAGSFFKNPEIDDDLFIELKDNYPSIPGYKTIEGKVKVPAGWLIEQAGWKGREEGNVATYKEQALVIINKGNATGKEIVCFSEKIKNAVYMKFAILLEEEVNII